MARTDKSMSGGSDLSHVLGNVSKAVGMNVKKAQSEVAAHPLTYVALAAGVGIAAGYLVNHMKKDECGCS